ncbi:major facilitator superfamily domain-containing protein [Thamnocephalis sphaerospora]|uniref:Major facilitator superfamily domain-containing protein n=1 Tax=Thamnocephalis sphaerospora TaxID=78915 RepID=A0A4P9XUX8_9FUNG|nr:major facilitator superfamily domain-containing protein [Thamnocephalis sphaerospora]|eukprot:RKP10038.1 major facilitator superfamily domain-containing protein [Thamnocephalis sphaerospora]
MSHVVRYGTPYLLQLGLSKMLISLVWLAGPLSGLLIQPLVGIYSDRCTSRIGRRRPFILFGGTLVLLSVYAIAHARWLAQKMLDLTGGGDQESRDGQIAIGIAVVGFYILDFSINAVQACLRALVVDTAPLDQQSRANAWAGRMIGVGSVLGYFAGFLDLVALFPTLGKSQMEVLCYLGSLAFTFCIGWTCLFVREERHVRSLDEERRSWHRPLMDILHAIRHLPGPVQRVCNVQFFAWLAWFPYLFYSTTWIIEILLRDHSPNEPGFPEAAPRAGSFALLLNALLTIFISFFLPPLTNYAEKAAARRRISLSHRDVFGPVRRAWEAAVDGMIVCWRLRGIWVLSNLFLGATLLSTWFVRDVFGAVFVIAICGLPWAITMWVPFAMVGELINADEEEQDLARDLPHAGPSTTSIERVQLEAGVALGIHNIYVVLPQFVSIGISTIIFAALHETDASRGASFVELNGDGDLPAANRHEPVGWVLRFGGICALVAAVLAMRCVQINHRHP